VSHDIKQSEEREAEQRSAPAGKIVYKAISKEGEEELGRSSSALFWSGLAAGLSMSFSMIAEGLLTSYLPNVPWRTLVAKFGYSAGFVIVILGRQQLFTENTLTPILPLLQKKARATFANVLRLWTVVLIANLLGAMAVAAAVAFTNVLDPEVRHTFAEMGIEAAEPAFAGVLLRGVFAGWLIALMVWLLPFAETGRFWVVIFIAYIVGIGHFSHIIAGAVEVFTASMMGQLSWSTSFVSFIIPALIGNIIGGVTLVAMLNHAQVVSGEDGQDI
jgi:formate/nitrite transporter FocA (FNT family)